MSKMADTKQELEEYKRQIECAICMDIMRTPRMLECEHTLCEHCLGAIVTIHSDICCPICRQMTKVPEEGVSKLTKNVLVFEMVKKYFDMLKSAESDKVLDDDEKIDLFNAPTRSKDSVSLRNIGNALYRKGLNEQDLEIKETIFQRAAHMYLRALEEAKTDTDKCKAEKNYSMAIIQRAEALVKQDDEFENSTTFYHLGIRYYNIALRSGSKVMGAEWLEDVEQKCREEVTKYLDRLRDLTDFQHAERLVDLAQCIFIEYLRLELIIKALDLYLNDKEFNITHLQRSHWPFYEMMRLMEKVFVSRKDADIIKRLEKEFLSKKEYKPDTKTPIKSEESESEKIRNAGNIVLRQAQDEHCLIYRQRRLEDAYLMYFRAISTAKTPTETEKATKNYATAAVNLAETLENMNAPQRSVIHYYWESITYTSKVLETIDKPTEEEKYDDRQRYLTSTIEGLENYISSMPADERGDYIAALAKLVHGSMKKMKLYQDALELYIQASVLAREANRYGEAKRILHECTVPLSQFQILAEASADTEKNDKVKELTDEIQYSLNRIESMEISAKGEEKVKKAVVNNANKDLLFSASDAFENTIMMADGKVPEVEAKANFWLAFIHHHLNNTKAARDHTTAGFQLLQPTEIPVEHLIFDLRMPEFLQVVLSNQKDPKAMNRTFSAQELEAARTRMAEELKKLNELWNKQDIQKFLEHIYKKHAPKEERARLSPNYKIDLLGALDTATAHYHPDLQDYDKDGIDWKIICTEISKIANDLIEKHKAK